jgi:hypothetical protein
VGLRKNVVPNFTQDRTADWRDAVRSQSVAYFHLFSLLSPIREVAEAWEVAAGLSNLFEQMRLIFPIERHKSLSLTKPFLYYSPEK